MTPTSPPSTSPTAADDPAAPSAAPVPDIRQSFAALIATLSATPLRRNRLSREPLAPRALALVALRAGTAQAGNRSCLRSAPALRAFTDLRHTLAPKDADPQTSRGLAPPRPRPGRGQAAEQRALGRNGAY